MTRLVGFLLWVVVDNWEKILRNLLDAYDLTLSGWGQALEYRQHETAGHSQRVVEMTIALAKGLGISSSELDSSAGGPCSTASARWLFQIRDCSKTIASQRLNGKL